MPDKKKNREALFMKKNCIDLNNFYARFKYLCFVLCPILLDFINKNMLSISTFFVIQCCLAIKQNKPRQM